MQYFCFCSFLIGSINGGPNPVSFSYIILAKCHFRVFSVPASCLILFWDLQDHMGLSQQGRDTVVILA